MKRQRPNAKAQSNKKTGGGKRSKAVEKDEKRAQ
jgi:hypothetical protein